MYLQITELIAEDVHYDFNPKLMFMKIDYKKKSGGYICNVTMNTLVNLEKAIVN